MQPEHVKEGIEGNAGADDDLLLHRIQREADQGQQGNDALPGAGLFKRYAEVFEHRVCLLWWLKNQSWES